jgi:hypothetical protein
MANLYNVPLENSVQLTLQNSLTAGDTATITFTSSVATKLQASSSMKGILIIDRVDSSGTETPTKTEIIAFTGVSASTVTGLTRGLSGTTDQDHGVGAIVEFMPDITWAQAINDVFNEQHNPDGTHKSSAFSSLASLNIANATITNPTINGGSLASITITNSTLDTFSLKINGFEGFGTNYRIMPSLASGNLVVALKTMDGNDPSATNPVYVRIGNTVRTVSTTLSATATAGTNWFNSGSTALANREVDYFVYLGFNGTDETTIGFSRIPFANLYSDFNTTTTNERHCKISTITNASSSDNYVNIGRFPATLSGVSLYNWSLPTLTNANLIQRPVYETRYLNYTPAFTVTSPMTLTGTSLPSGFYKIVGDQLSVAGSILQAKGGSALTYDAYISIPFSVNVPNNTPVGVSTIDNLFGNSGMFGGTATTLQFRTASNMSVDGVYRNAQWGVSGVRI